MKISFFKKSIAAALSVFVVGGTLPAVQLAAPVMTSFAEEYTEVTEGVLTYHVYPDHAFVTDCDGSVVGEVTIPAEINGVPVTAIGNEAFYHCVSLTSVVLPDSILGIAPFAFEDCYSLKSITLPEGLTDIASFAFDGSGLEKITIPKSVTNIEWLAFRSTPWIAALQEQDPLVVVNGILIDGTTCEGDVIVPNGVKRIITNAFRKGPEDFTNITSVTIPKSVTDIDDACFFGTGTKKVTFLNSSVTIPEHITAGTEYITTFVGYEGSTAQTFAEENGLEFISLGVEPELQLGDLDGDGTIDASDASAVLAEYAEIQTGAAPTVDLAVGDVNTDTALDATDASSILSYFAYTQTGGSGSLSDFLKTQ